MCVALKEVRCGSYYCVCGGPPARYLFFILLLHISLLCRIEGLHYCFFFFSSRRRHTRSLCDWSSDVCSSDLQRGRAPILQCSSADLLILRSLPHTHRERAHRFRLSCRASLLRAMSPIESRPWAPFLVPPSA